MPRWLPSGGGWGEPRRPRTFAVRASGRTARRRPHPFQQRYGNSRGHFPPYSRARVFPAVVRPHTAGAGLAGNGREVRLQAGSANARGLQPELWL